MAVEICAMSMLDYDEAMCLWQSSEGVGLSRADEREAIARYLARNPGMSFVARDGGELVGTVLAGHDGRRGYVHHLAVRTSHRRMGIGRALAGCCLAALKADGIDKTHLFVFGENRTGRDFWREAGWYERLELVIMSIDQPE
jgi:N-acetylglutamate synthase